MTQEWQRLLTTTIETMPRLGWRGRWDALLYAVRWHKFLRTAETPMTFSLYAKSDKELLCQIETGRPAAAVCGVQVEQGRIVKDDPNS